MSALLLAVSFSSLRAEEARPPAPDPDLPQPLDFSFADALVMQSPFSRTVSFDNTYQLTGVASVDGHPVATVLNKETKQRFVVTEQPNAQGWALIAASAGPDLHHTEVEMSVGGEIVAMQYGGQQLSPGSTGPDGNRARMAGGGPGKGDNDKVRASAFLGEEGKKLYASLSREGRDKLKDLLKSRMEKHPELTPEQNSAYAQKMFAKIKATDQPSANGNTKQPKAPKMSRKNPGA